MPFPNADGRDYAIFPVAKKDPVSLDKSGKLYTKLDAGVAQLFFQADDGTVYQITPVSSGGGLTSSLIYDPANPTLGNSYQTFAELITAASAIGGPVNVYVASNAADATRNAGNYDVSLINFIGFGSNLFFNGATLEGGRLSVESLVFENLSATPLITAATDWQIFLSGGASLRASGGYCVLIDESNVELFIADNALLENSGIEVLASAAPFNGILKVVNESSNPLLVGAWSQVLTIDLQVTIWDFSAQRHQILINSFLPGVNCQYNGTKLGQNTPGDPIAAQANDYAPEVVFSSDVIRVELTGNQNMTGLASDFTTREVTLINGDATNTLTLVHQSAASQETFRFLCNTGANIAVPPNGIAKLLYDISAQRWRVWLC